MSVSDRYFDSNYTKSTDQNEKTFDETLCSWCQCDKATENYMGVKVCNECKFDKLNHESSGEKYDRYTSMGISHEEAVIDCYDGVEP